MKIYVTGFAGDTSSYEIAKKNKEIISKRFSSSFIKRFESLGIDENGKALDSFPGIYSQLWDLSKENGKGFEIKQDLIPVKQETIEICELVNEDPYQTEGSAKVVFSEKEMPFDSEYTEIGHTTDNNDKKIIIGDIIRYLNRN